MNDRTTPGPRWPGGRVRAVAVPGGMLPVETLGAGAPLILLHGWTLDRRMWVPQAALADKVMLVGIDRRGFGEATAPAALAQEPDDVLRVADALGLARFHLLGMSQGGRVALALAERAPERLLSLVLAAPALDGVAAPDEGVPLAAMAAAAMAAATGAGDRAALLALWRDHPLARSRDPAVAAILADYDGRDLVGDLTALPALAGRIAGMPTTVITGAEDTPRRHVHAAALVAAGARGVVLAGAGHLANMDAPGEFNAAVRAAVGGT
ncbi:MAG: hypothetical protein CFE37_10770 [Alphaproteobacteria bacterium PA4]|nr:MAG: hypothetical protein CFE37_10770 [Alphaproteobacteria bacterium PA4]